MNYTKHIRRLRWVAFVVGALLASQLHAFPIYEEGFVSPWANGSVGATIISENPAGLSLSAYCGSKTAIVNHSAGGEFRAVAPGGQNVGGNNALIFAVQNYTSNMVDPTSSLSVQAYDSNNVGKGWISVLPYLTGGRMRANQWYSVEIPLTALNIGTSIRGVGFKSGAQLVYAWDCMRVEWRAAFEPPPPPPPTPASSILFSDSFGARWTVYEWDATHNSNLSQFYSGALGLNVNYARSWAGFQFWPTTFFNTTGYNMLTFAIYGGAQGGQEIWVSLYDNSSNRLNHLNLANYLVGKVLTPYNWHLVRIPLADLGGLNRIIKALEFESATATTITLDDVRFDSLTDNNTGVCNVN
jgi:hypothetical protein